MFTQKIRFYELQLRSGSFCLPCQETQAYLHHEKIEPTEIPLSQTQLVYFCKLFEFQWQSFDRNLTRSIVSWNDLTNFFNSSVYLIIIKESQ
jgi:hypothetical protein